MKDSPLKILLVEDSAMVYTHVEKFLRKHGHEVIKHPVHPYIKSYKDAVEALELTIPQLAILDIEIKGDKDGIELAEFIKDKFYCPIIFLSGKNTDQNLFRTSMMDTATFVVKKKPVNLEQLITDIRQFRLKTDNAGKKRTAGAFFRVRQLDVAVEDGTGFRTIRIEWKDIASVTTGNLIAKNSSIFIFRDGRKFIVHQYLSEVQQSLPPFFLRIADDMIVNKEAINGWGKSIWSFYIDAVNHKVGDAYRTENNKAILTAIRQ